jgi:type II secretory pathway pseudopilin PulG
MKKAAMFGLDARIALAIFGALSVISGAALYSAIQGSKVTSSVTSLNEVLKSIEAYMLDTGQDLPNGKIGATTYAFAFDGLGLIEDNSVSGWNGPYISLQKNSAAPNYNLIGYKDAGSILGTVHFKKAMNNTWDAPDTNGVCDGSAPCFAWVENAYMTDIAKAMDVMVDGSDTPTTGNLRYKIKDTGDPSRGSAVYLKGPLTLNQN